MDLVADDVVISGIGGYFPKAKNINEFREKLFTNENLVEPKWAEGERGVCHISGKIPSEYFDNSYFGIHRQQCTFMDPMQRSVLERTFEALVDAGVNPAEVKGRRIGVYMGSSIGENDNLFLESVVSGFGVTGHSRAMMPNRISYWLNLKGPSVAYDSNWIGGIEVLRLAYSAIKTGQCEGVIIGTANLAMNSEFQWIYNDMGLLSQDGSTRAFDADAQGYARSDGVVVMYIQRASEAKRHYASIINVATRFDGCREGGLLDIDVPNMVEFMEDFYKKSSVKPEEVEFVEAYGCAIKETDKKELDALEKVYCKNRKNPLLIGSVKTQTGHSEASSALFSIVKVILAMEAGVIPANIQFSKPNPDIGALANGSMEIVTQNRKWNGLYAAVNALGIDSYYGHVLLKANPKNKFPREMHMPYLMLASTRTQEGVDAILETIKLKPKDPEYYQLFQDLFAKPILGHLYRGYSILGPDGELKKESQYHMGNKREIWFVYSGMGSQWTGMVSDLMRIDVFEKSIRNSHKVLLDKEIDLIKIITTDDKSVFDNILNCFVGIAAIQIALTDVLASIGIKPDGIIGHSVGELGCAYADGCLTAEQMILSAYSRGRASLEATLIKGMMAAIGLGYNNIKSRLPPSIEVACHNSSESCTISGPTEDMEKFVKDLQDQGIFARLVNVANIAYHSQYIKPAAPLLLKYLKTVIPEPVKRSSKWVSTSNLEENWNTDLAECSSAEYHTNNLLSSVYFEEGIKHIPKDSILIEIAPHGLLQAILKRSIKTGCNIPLTQRGSKSGLEFLLQNLGKLYLAGLDFSISNLYPKIEYPVSRGTSTLSDTVHWNHSEAWRTGVEDKLQSLFGVRDVQVTLNSEEFRECVGHQLNNNIVMPTSFYLNLVNQIIATISSAHKEIIFENIHVKKILQIPRIGSVPLHAMVQRGSGEFEILSDKDIIMTGKITFPQSGDKFMLDPIEIEMAEEHVQLSGSDVYNELQHRGHKYSGLFKCLKSLTLTEEGSVSIIQYHNKWMTLLEAMIQQQLLQSGEKTQEVFVPKFIQKIAISQTQLPEEKTDLQVNFDYATGMLAVDGIQLIGMKAVPLESEVSPMELDSLEYMPLNQVLNSMEYAINFAVQLTMSNFDDQNVTNLMITEIESKNLLTSVIKNVLDECSLINANLTLASNNKQIVIQQSYPLLLITNSVPSNDVLNMVSSSHAFLFAKTDKNILAHPEIIEVAQFTINSISYSITRKINKSLATVINVKGDTLSVKDLKRLSVSWVSGLYSAIEETRAKQSPVFLISTLVPLEGFSNFLQELKSLPNMQPLKLIFNLDKKSADLTHLFKQNLTLSILKDGVASAFLPIALKFKDNIKISNITSSVIKNKTVKYLGINLRDETLLTAEIAKNEMGNIDYSGIGSNGQNVMGLAKLDKENNKLEDDALFTWEVPNSWSLEDAATVPHAYTSAFYMLMVKARLKPGETVLVHSGCSAVGLAAISISRSHGCKVYTTVSTDWQRAYLKKHFTFLKDRDIFSSVNSTFEPNLKMATGGRGAEVILNCVSGSLLQSSFACLADYGRFIQYGQYDLEEGNQIGMYSFLRNTSFYAVNLNNVFLQSKEVKEELRDLMQDGIQKLSVRPLWRTITTNQDFYAILGNLKNPSIVGKIIINIDNNVNINKLNVQKPNRFICDSRSSYLVYGGNSENWTDITEWLVLRGARKVVISSDSKPQQNHINRRLSLLQTYYGADVVMAPNKSHTKEGAAELLSEVYFLGPIHGVFLLPNKNGVFKSSDIKPIQYIENALRTTAPKALFVNFIPYAAGVCQSRSDTGFCTYNIQWLKELDLSNVFLALDDILNAKIKTVLVKGDRSNDINAEGTQGLFKKLNRILPTPSDIIYDQKRAPKEPELVQLVTEGPREIRELAPVFIIPGITGRNELKQLALGLLYPTFCAVLPYESWSIKKLAEVYVEKMCKIWPKGPYNIIGISWGGALTVEIARLLNKTNASLHLFFIDSAPNTLQAVVKHLGEKTTEREISILSRIFTINNNETIENMKKADSWPSRVKLALESTETDANSIKHLLDGLDVMKERLESVYAYQANDQLVSGLIHFIRPDDSSKYDNCGLTSFCKQTPHIVLVKGDHLSIINNPETCEYINKSHYLK